MAEGCLDNLKMFFVYLRFQLIIQYTAMQGTSMTCQWQYSVFASLLLAILSMFYLINTFMDARGLIQNVLLSELDITHFKFSILMLCQRVIVTIFIVWLQRFSRNSSHILERIVKHLQKADDLLGDQPERKRRVQQFVGAFFTMKFVTIVAMIPTALRLHSIPMKLKLFNDILVNFMENDTEQIFIVMCSEIHARLEKLQVK